MHIFIFRKRHLYVAALVIVAIIILIGALIFTRKANPAYTFPVFQQALLAKCYF